MYTYILLYANWMLGRQNATDTEMMVEASRENPT
jgi:hypothetical protein